MVDTLKSSSPSRRSPMRRTPKEKTLAITPRDLAIFRALSQYRYLRSTYLYAFAGGGSETRFKERLGDLFHENYIDRPEKQWEFAQARHMPAIYEIGYRARQIMREIGTGTQQSTTFLGQGSARQFAHALLICECLASFELSAKDHPGLRFIPWYEIRARMAERPQNGVARPARATAVFPDGLFGLEYTADGRKFYRFFALEIDRGTMPIVRSDRTQTSILEKLRVYKQMTEAGQHKDRWGVPNLMVLVVTTTEQRKVDMIHKCAALGDAPHFLFKALGMRNGGPDAGLLADAWQRIALAPLSIIADPHGRPCGS